MASSSSSSKCNRINDENNNSSFNNQEPHHHSYFLKSVTLGDWWLTKSDSDFHGKTLAVSGYVYGERKPLRVFHSAPITKRFDVFTLETSDGITVIFQGFINKQKTLENGFSPQVFDDFLFGFPPTWEKYADDCFKQSTSSKENDVGDVENDASEEIPLVSSCHVNSVSLMKDNGAVEAEPSNHHAVEEPLISHAEESSLKLNDVERKKKGNKSTEKSENKHSACLESITIHSNTSEECSVPKDVCMDNLDASNLKQTGEIEAHKVVLALRASLPRKAKKTATTDFSTALSQGPQAEIGCINVAEVMGEGSVGSAAVRDSSTIKEPSNHIEDVLIFSTVKNITEINDAAPSTIERGPADATPSNPQYEKRSKSLADKVKKNQKRVSEDSLKHKITELTPEIVDNQAKRRLRKSSDSTTHQAAVKTPRAMLKATRSLRSLPRNVEHRAKSPVKKGGSFMKKTRRKIIFDTDVTPLTSKSNETRKILSPESLSLKRSRSGRLLLPTLDFWRNQIPVYDMNRNVTGIQEEIRRSRGSKSEPQKKNKKGRK